MVKEQRKFKKMKTFNYIKENLDFVYKFFKNKNFDKAKPYTKRYLKNSKIILMQIILWLQLKLKKTIFMMLKIIWRWHL